MHWWGQTYQWMLDFLECRLHSLKTALQDFLKTPFSFMGSKLFFLLPISLYTFCQASYKIKLNLLPFQVRNIARVIKELDDVSLIGFKLWIFIVSMHSAIPNLNENKNPSLCNFSQGWTLLFVLSGMKIPEKLDHCWNSACVKSSKTVAVLWSKSRSPGSLLDVSEEHAVCAHYCSRDIKDLSDRLIQPRH